MLVYLRCPFNLIYWQSGEADRLGGQRVAAAPEGGSGRGNQCHEQDQELR